jgi:hypothetical protein
LVVSVLGFDVATPARCAILGDVMGLAAGGGVFFDISNPLSQNPVGGTILFLVRSKVQPLVVSIFPEGDSQEARIGILSIWSDSKEGDLCGSK